MAGQTAGIGAGLGWGALFLLAVCPPAASVATRPVVVPPRTLAGLAAMQAGGHVIFMRHAPGDTALPDRFQGVDLQDCSTQRPLSADGRQLASHLGGIIRQLDIPVGEVLASPYCRTMESAQLTFGKVLPETALLNTAYLTIREKAPAAKALRTLLAEPVPLGGNRILVSHSSTLADGTGIFPKREGALAVFRPDGRGGFRHIASLLPADLEVLAKPRGPGP